MKRRKLWLSLLISCLAGLAYGETSTVLCPPADALVKNPKTLTWSAANGTFQSYDTSFSEKIVKFAGAQWAGAAVGQVTCVYKTLPKASFPVLLIFYTLAQSPTGGAWTKDLGGYKNCESSQPKDCAFNVFIKQQQGDIYKEAEKLKSNPSITPDE